MAFQLCLHYAIRRVQVNQDGLKLNDAHKLLTYAGDVNILGGRAHAIKKDTVALSIDSMEIRLQVNADKTTSLSTCSCLEIRMKDDVTIYSVPEGMCQTSGECSLC
jgi:hypothetical protein